MIVDIILLVSIIIILLFVIYLLLCQSPKENINNIHISELSKIWLRYNHIEMQNTSDETNTSISEEKVEPIDKESELSTTIYKYQYQDVLNLIINSINTLNENNKCPIFSFQGSIYVHTSGLKDIIKQLNSKLSIEEEKEKTSEIVRDFIENNISSPFEKYFYQEHTGKKIKTLYLKLNEDICSKEYKDREEIILMEKINE